MDTSTLIQQATIGDIEAIVGRVVRKELTALLSGFSQPKSKAAALVPRREAAHRLGVSLTTIDNWAKAGIIHAIRRGGRVYFSEKELIKE